MPYKQLFPLVFVFAFLACQQEAPRETPMDNYNWDSYLGGIERDQYAPLDQINRNNVHQLKVAWEYASENGDSSRMGQIQNNPLIIDGVLYGTSPTLKVFALEADTGEEIWKFDHTIENINYGMNVNRGLTYYANGNDRRIYFTAGPFLYALNAENGELLTSFGDNGTISLRTGLDQGEEKAYYVVATSPGVIYGDFMIIGFRTLESMGAAPGFIRAFNIHSGELEWTFHTIPQPGEYGYHTWPPNAYQYIGGANSWAGVSLDSVRGIVYIPTGSAAFDFYGGNRKGANLFANCILALDASTGERIWHHQVVHHDVWDRDIPAPPILITIDPEGKQIPALAQITKHGYVYLFNRLTGEPIFEIEEQPVPANSPLVGEELWPTQPIPVKPPPFARQQFRNDQVYERLDQETRKKLTAIITGVNKEHIFTPPSQQGTLIFPGFDGGGEWGGAAVDPNGIMYVNNNEMPWILTMVETGESFGVSSSDQEEFPMGKQLYQSQCALCHGPDMEGDPVGTYPPLKGLESKYNRDEMISLLNQGKNLMPAFNHIPLSQREAVVDFVLGLETQIIEEDVHNLGSENNLALPYAHTGYNRFVGPEGNPAIEPPWGTLSAIDLNQGEILWQVTLGEFDHMTEQGIPKTGAENYGGPIATAGGLIFIAATKDEYIRAFDQETGEEIWRYKLPAAGHATPSTYMVNGKQYLVIACGGGKLGTKPGDRIVAFALP
ncbi:MAG: outer membrane protein assembly factor BamB family protein [Candidatus Cyclobacteriaceae bacterium M3_2C_046]